MKGPWLVELAAKFRAGVKVAPRPESAGPAGCYLPRLTWKTGSFWKENPLCAMFRGAFPSGAALLWEEAASLQLQHTAGTQGLFLVTANPSTEDARRTRNQEHRPLVCRARKEERALD